MKVLRFFARFTLICNISFLLFIIFRWIELKKQASSASEVVVEVPFFKNLIITLGFTAIFINVAFHLVVIITMLMRRIQVPVWLIITNFLFLLFQLYYFFFYNP